MTRIHVLSDLHLERAKFKDYTPPECDVVLLSGDIHAGVAGVMWALETFRVPVVYPPGNHEFWGRVLLKHVAEMKAKAEGSHVHVLYNDTVVIDGVRFIGSTLWTDFNLFNNPMSVTLADLGIKDFGKEDEYSPVRKPNILKSPRVRFTATDSHMEHMVARQFLTEQLATPYEGKTVVATHHAPSILSIAPMWRNDPLSPAFASRLEDLMLDYAPALWTHGHVHESFDYMMGETRVVCNPRGYLDHFPNREFDPALVITI